jgi:uncharacterized Zn-binding protein involved in type VI secretion
MPPASRITDLHTCPAHVGGPVATGSADTIIGSMPAARVTDRLVCAGAVDVIRQGSSNVLINNLQAARIGDPTVHLGLLASGDPTVIIGETPQSFALIAAAASGIPFVEECEQARQAREEAEAAARDAAAAEADAPQEATVAEPPPPPENPYETTEAERELAAAEGASPEQRAAREKVVREFYETNAADGLGQQRADQDLGVGGAPPRANAHPAGFGIDLSTPLRVVAFPPPEQVAMFVRRTGPGAGLFGNFIDPSQPPGSQTGNLMGLNDDSALRKKVILDLPPGGGLALESGNGPIVDGWTDPVRPVATGGGGRQWTVPNSVKESVACSRCGSPADPGARQVRIGAIRVAPRRCTC